MKKRDIEELEGKTLKSVVEIKEGIEFITVFNERYLLFHDQDCCESVWLEEVIGDLDDLVGSPIIRASEDTNSDDPGKLEHSDDSYTWTFYNIATGQGHVTLRWYGTSNGYYSESVDFSKIQRFSTYEAGEKGAKALGKNYYIPVWGTDDTGFIIYY